MLKIKLQLSIAVILSFVSGCTRDTAPSQTLTEANRIHLAAIALHEKVEERLEELKKKSQTDRNGLLASKTDSLQKLVELWELGVIEVPGFSHRHERKPGTHHEHKQAPKMTDDSMLDYQKSAFLAIEEIAGEMDKISVQKKTK